MAELIPPHARSHPMSSFAEKREEWRKLVAESTVVPQRSGMQRDR